MLSLTGTPHEMLSADLQDDSDQDLIFRTSNGLIVAYDDGSGNFSTQTIATQGQTLEIGDINQDGFPDVLTTEGDSLWWYLGSATNLLDWVT